MNGMYGKPIRDCIRELNTSLNMGLTDDEAQKRLERDGKNILRQKREIPLAVRFLSQFKDFMVIILLIAAAVSLATGLYSGEGIADSLIIIAIVILNAVVGTLQESKAQKAIALLNGMTVPHCAVKRGGELKSCDTSLLVCGDIIRLKQGDIVPADCRLIEAHSLKVSEANLTGESVPVDKDAETVLAADTPLGERCNMLYRGTCVVLGRCDAVVCATGMYSEMGRIADMLNDTEEETPLQKKLAVTGKMLGTGALIICFVIFVMGVVRGFPLFNMFMTSVSLAVAAIPEGLPAIVTVVLALGTKRMAEKRAIVRKLPAVEALGCANVICTDKTGTLTLNKMQLTEIYAHNKALVTELTALCSDCEKQGDSLMGDPTELALVEAAEKNGIDKAELEKIYPRLDEYPFDPVSKRMTTIHKHGNGVRCITKGAAEFVIPLCDYYEGKNGRERMTDETRKMLAEQNENMCARALRVLAVAAKEEREKPKNRKYAEYALTFCGFAGIADPPRPEVREAVEKCELAGIRTIMITGDNPVTARAVAQKTGIIKDEGKVITGSDIDLMTNEVFAEEIKSVSAFARVTPSHKVRIVKALKANDDIVAMTGDGVNDAPALKAADIGCAMGITGTEAAKSAADIVLTDDNFATIVDAVKEGRGIYENIKKAVHFLLSSNIGEIITIFAAMVSGFGSPLAPAQLLWVNLVTDSLPAIALGLDSCDEDIMQRLPKKETSLLSKELWTKIALEGAMIGMLALLAFSVGLVIYDNALTGRTMAFAVLSISQLVHAFNMRSEHSVFNTNIFDNRYLVLSLIIGVIMQVGVIQLPFAADIFSVCALSCIQWLCVIMLSFMPVIIVELEKYLGGDA